MHPNLNLDCAAESDRICQFILQTLQEAHSSRVVVGLSGGIDSSLVATLAVRCLGHDNVLGMLLPYRSSHPDSKAHALITAENLQISYRTFEITPMITALVEANPEITALRMGNIMARCRMTVLYDASAAFGGLVAGTSNRTETLLGYFTMHGDGAAAFKPIAHLYKCQVRQLASYLELPQVIIDKAPSADLWDGQTDEGDLGFTYNQADEVLYLLSECHWCQDQISALGIDPRVVQAIAKRMAATAFKRCDPPALIPSNKLAPAVVK
ncbi:MAG: NAD+ synthase [Anaerolineae bacterium]